MHFPERRNRSDCDMLLAQSGLTGRIESHAGDVRLLSVSMCQCITTTAHTPHAHLRVDPELRRHTGPVALYSDLTQEGRYSGDIICWRIQGGEGLPHVAN
ncbi:hypothetical protein XENOCAPTIV_018232 [Xenoophorus captivus]|uniref:Uncharacterized protein n=1 Tax=Xenoophorus captivus TaxID=1517983 RepID=A0ABV0SIT1_9TELE